MSHRVYLATCTDHRQVPTGCSKQFLVYKALLRLKYLSATYFFSRKPDSGKPQSPCIYLVNNAQHPVSTRRQVSVFAPPRGKIYLFFSLCCNFLTDAIKFWKAAFFSFVSQQPLGNEANFPHRDQRSGMCWILPIGSKAGYACGIFMPLSRNPQQESRLTTEGWGNPVILI